MAADEPKRARRRRDLLRMKAKARRLHPTMDQPERCAEHLAVCSCWMCGNPRRHLGERSVQERRRAFGNAPAHRLGTPVR